MLRDNARDGGWSRCRSPFGSLQGTDTAPPGHEEETSSLMTCRGPGQQDPNKNPKRRQHSSTTKSGRRLRSTLSRSVSRQHRIIDGFANNFPGSLQPAACATLICSEALGIREVVADRDKKLVKLCPVSRLCDHQNNVYFAKALVARLGCDQISWQEKVCGYGIKWRHASCAAAVFLLNFTYSYLRSPTPALAHIPFQHPQRAGELPSSLSRSSFNRNDVSLRWMKQGDGSCWNVSTPRFGS